MGLFSTLVGWLTDPAVGQAIDGLTVENNYKDLGVKGKLLSYLEKQEGIGALLKKLGDNRGELYRALLAGKAGDMVCATFFSS